jgi:hypothetical protein
MADTRGVFALQEIIPIKLEEEWVLLSDVWISPSPSIVTSGLVLNLDAGNTASYPGSGTTWTDLSGNGNTGTLTNGPTYNSANGGSIVFDGSNDYVTLLDSDNWHFSSGNFTAECWVYPTASPAQPILVGQWDGFGGGAGLSWVMLLSNNSNRHLRAAISSTGSGVDFDLISSTSLGLNQWNHCAFVRTGSTFTLYLNGVSVASTTNSNALFNATNSLTIGASSSNTQPFNGRISNVKIYKGKGLTATEISQNYNALALRFGLIQERQVVRYSDGASASPNTGYFGGGFNNPSTSESIMDKVTYSTDTTAVVPSATLTVIRYSPAATGNSTAGYFGGGAQPGGFLTSIDKVTYVSDTTALVPSATLSAARYGLAATGNSTNGYFGGGNSPGVRSIMDKVTYSTDTAAAVPGANLSVSRFNVSATGNSTTGYFGGGQTPGYVSTMDKVTYSTDTTAAVPGANLTISRGSVGATGNSTAGYFGGGGFPNYSTMDKVTYSSDTTAAVPGANLIAATRALSATGNSTNGYFGGGLSSAITAQMYKVTYSTDTTLSVPGANLSLARYFTGTSSARANALPVVEPPAATPTPTTSLGNGPAPNTGYFGGGSNVVATMDKLTYASDTTAAVPGANLSVARSYAGATGNSNAGYFGGGFDGGNTSSIMDKVTYSSDTTVRIPAANLSLTRYNLAATGNSTAGYFGGGGPTPITPEYSTMDKVTYSSDTTAAVPGANLSSPRWATAATGNSTNGYFGGGYTPATVSTMDKVTYATDTTAAVPGAALSAARYGLAATGNSTNGYFGGGSGPGVRSTMDKVTYSSDTTSAVPGANLSVARQYLAATGNLTNGYFGSGFTPGPTASSLMNKVTYSSDTTAAVPGAALSAARYGVAASSARANALQFVPNIV